MKVFLTSNPAGHLDNSRSVHDIDHKDQLREKLRLHIMHGFSWEGDSLELPRSGHQMKRLLTKLAPLERIF